MRNPPTPGEWTVGALLCCALAALWLLMCANGG